MTRLAARQAVHEYYLRALRDHFNGNVAALLRAIEPEAPAIPYRTAVGWKSPAKAVNVPAFFLVAVARATGDSLDEAVRELALPEQERRALQDQIRDMDQRLHEARLHLAIIQEEINRLRSARGEPPMEYPRTGTG